VREGIEAVAEQAGWHLALAAPDELLDREVTLTFKNVPATQALRVILETGDLYARLTDGVLVVKPVHAASAHARTEKTDIRLPIGDVKVKVHPGRSDRKHGPAQEERTNFGGDVVVKAGEVLEGDAVAVGGSVIVEAGAVVEGDAVASGGSVRLEAGAVVEGDAVAVGGEVVLDPGAVVEGDQVSIGGGLGGVVKSLVNIGVNEELGVHSIFLSVLWTLLRALTLLVIGVLLLTFVPENVGRVRGFLDGKPGHAALAGLAVLLGFVPLCILLAVTIIGIPLIPVAALVLAAMLVMGLTAFATWLGYRIPIFAGRKSAVGALLIGLVVITLVDLIPIVGTTLVTLVGFFAGGAVLLSRFGRLAPPASPSADVAAAI
jgi:hypothetical protein